MTTTQAALVPPEGIHAWLVHGSEGLTVNLGRPGEWRGPVLKGWLLHCENRAENARPTNPDGTTPYLIAPDGTQYVWEPHESRTSADGTRIGIGYMRPAAGTVTTGETS